MKYIFLPSHYVDKIRREREQTAIRVARHRYKYPERRHDTRTRHDDGPPPFVMWDGEGPRDAGYALFGNSEGYEICHPFLSTRECLELILETEADIPNAIHISFGFNYDVSNIIKDLPRRCQTALHHFKRVVWDDFELEHIPHKWFMVKRGQVRAKIYDIRSFFAGGYVDALLEFNIGTDNDIKLLRSGKGNRAEFQWADIAEIREYFRLELRLGPLLAGRLRELFTTAGYSLRSWHGPGALARMALKRHKIYDAMTTCPNAVRIAARYAFAGGHFELFWAGHIQTDLYVADLNSAYPYYATMLPNLKRGTWRTGRRYEPGKFAVYHIRYEGDPKQAEPHPLFKREANFTVSWPHRVEGWYWTPEAELVKDNPRAKFIEALVFDEDDPADKPFAWLAEYYHRRLLLKRIGDPAQWTFKLIINAIYGQLAQRVGWNRKTGEAPASHQLEWAGFITSGCRAAVYKLAQQCGTDLVSIDTDGVTSMRPFTGVESTDRLGGWEVKTYKEGVFWQSGIYSLREDLNYDAELGYGWKRPKSRGIKKGSYDAEQLLDCLYKNKPLQLSRHLFVGYGLADSGQWERRNTWINEPHTYTLGGGSKRYHLQHPTKHRCMTPPCKPPMHPLYLPTIDATDTLMSVPHHLPWLDETDKTKLTMDDEMMFAVDDLEVEYYLQEVA